MLNLKKSFSLPLLFPFSVNPPGIKTKMDFG